MNTLFNFSANHLTLISTTEYDKAFVAILNDEDTKRCYKVYDFVKAFIFQPDKIYCISGKINSADKLYLILEAPRTNIQWGAQSLSPSRMQVLLCQGIGSNH